MERVLVKLLSVVADFAQECLFCLENITIGYRKYITVARSSSLNKKKQDWNGNAINENDENQLQSIV